MKTEKCSGMLTLCFARLFLRRRTNVDLLVGCTATKVLDSLRRGGEDMLFTREMMVLR